MTLHINRWETRCRVPRGREGCRVLVEGVASGALSHELTGVLGPSLDRLSAVIRLNRLKVDVRVPAHGLTASKLANVWARAFARSLHQAIGRPAGDAAVRLRRHSSAAQYKAAMMHHLAGGGAFDSWEFPELAAMRGATPALAALDILLEAPDWVAEILGDLHRRESLDRLMLGWDEVCLERILRALAPADSNTRDLSVETLVEMAGRVRRAMSLLPRSRSAGRREAIRLWMQMGQRPSLRSLWHGLRLILALAENPWLLSSHAVALPADPIPFPAWCEALLSMLATPSAAIDQRSPALRKLSTDLSVALDALRAQLPAAAPPRTPAAENWIHSDCAGLLLMLSVVRRLDFWRLSRCPEFSRFGGPRALSFLLAALGMTLLERWKIGEHFDLIREPLDPAVALFAGIFAEPDRLGMNQFLSEAGVAAVADWIAADSWPVALQGLADALARAFAGRVPGFRNASRQAVVKQFLRIPGRVLVEDRRVKVTLDYSAWSVALHMSSMDAALDSVEWLGGRRVEFTLQGL